MAKLLWLVFDMSAAEPEVITGFSTLEEAERFAESQVEAHDKITLGVSCEPILCEES
jgi:hypothetical protein